MGKCCCVEGIMLCVFINHEITTNQLYLSSLCMWGNRGSARRITLPKITKPVNSRAVEWNPDMPGYPAYVLFFIPLPIENWGCLKMSSSKRRGGGVGWRKQQLNCLRLIRFKPCIASCLFFLPHSLARQMPDKAFWTLRYQGATDELKPCLSGTDILPVLSIMEVT